MWCISLKVEKVYGQGKKNCQEWLPNQIVCRRSMIISFLYTLQNMCIRNKTQTSKLWNAAYKCGWLGCGILWPVTLLQRPATTRCISINFLLLQQHLRAQIEICCVSRYLPFHYADIAMSSLYCCCQATSSPELHAHHVKKALLTSINTQLSTNNSDKLDYSDSFAVPPLSP